MLGIEKLLARVPPSLLLRLGELEHRHPRFQRLVSRVSARWLGGDRVIAGGVGAGLRFNAEGGIAGYTVGITELTVQQELARVVRPGDVVYDIGASIGFLTVICARMTGPEGRVVAFEPNPAAAARLSHNVALNHFANVDVVEAGVADRAGVGTLVDGAHDNASGLVWAHVETGGDGGLRLTTIDDEVAAGMVPPQVVKLDIEGGEGAALRGMATTLRVHRPVVLCEIHDTLAEVTELLGAAGYEMRQLAGEGLSDDPAYAYLLGTPPRP